jgi:hypothetical protein
VSTATTAAYVGPEIGGDSAVRDTVAKNLWTSSFRIVLSLAIACVEVRTCDDTEVVLLALRSTSANSRLPQLCHAPRPGRYGRFLALPAPCSSTAAATAEIVLVR